VLKFGRTRERIYEKNKNLTHKLERGRKTKDVEETEQENGFCQKQWGPGYILDPQYVPCTCGMFQAILVSCNQRPGLMLKLKFANF
jgi:hypothetical protein